jgi:hypothetical protein
MLSMFDHSAQPRSKPRHFQRRNEVAQVQMDVGIDQGRNEKPVMFKRLYVRPKRANGRRRTACEESIALKKKRARRINLRGIGDRIGVDHPAALGRCRALQIPGD